MRYIVIEDEPQIGAYLAVCSRVRDCRHRRSLSEAQGSGLAISSTIWHVDRIACRRPTLSLSSWR